MEVKMKKKIATVLFSIATALSAQEATIEQPSASLPQLTAVVKSEHAKSYTYLRMGVSDTDAINAFETIPSAGLGFRYAVPSAVVDMSANYTREYGSNDYSYTLPKVSYLRYATPAKDQSFYYGAGLAWGGVEKAALTDDPNSAVSFQGLVPNATIGMEMNRNSNWRSFVQLDVSQPAVAVSAWDNWSVSDLPSMLAEVSFGLGY